MKKIHSTLIFSFLYIIAIASSNLSKNNTLVFTENKGQISDQNYKPRTDVLYNGSDGKLNYFIKNTGISYQLNRIDEWQTKERIRGFGDFFKVPSKISTYRVDVNWKNSNPEVTTVTDEMFASYNNYYLAVCPDGITNVRSYNGVRLKNVYPNIDIHYYEKGGLKCDYIIAPYTDYKLIQLEVDGADLFLDDDGGVVLKTPFGDIKEASPIAYQNGKKLIGKWIVNENILSFDIQNYDSNYELIIDPLTRVWGTYCGGTGDDQAQSVLADATGNTYLYGHTSSNNTIATTGSHQSTFGGGQFDVFFVKFDSNGQRLYGTYIGGSGDEVASAAVMDQNGNIYVSGETSSSSAIATTGTQQTTSAGQTDAFIVKLNASGVRQWGTYYGGNLADSGKNLAIPLNGSFIVIAGETSSPSGMVGGSGGGQAYGGGAWDSFVAKFDTNGMRLWGTYYGGTVLDDGYACAADNSGNVYLLGLTESLNNIASSNAYQPTINGSRDAFVVKFSSSGTRLWGTYFGGGSTEVATAATCDVWGNLYFCGWTKSGSDIATPGTQQTTYAGGSDDSFIEKFTTNGTRIWGTYIGGSGSDHINGCVADSVNLYIAGTTTSSTSGVIASSDGFQTTYAGGSQGDAFLVKYDSTGTRKWGTYYGGSASDVALSCVLDKQGNSYLAGISSSSSDIATIGTHQSTKNGTTDAFLVKFNYTTSVDILENLNQLNVTTYPNPTTGEINVNMHDLYSELAVNIYNLLGQKVQTEMFNSTQLLALNITGEKGVYIVEIITKENQAIKLRVVKK